MNPGLTALVSSDLPTCLFSTETDRAEETHILTDTHINLLGLCGYVDLVVD